MSKQSVRNHHKHCRVKPRKSSHLQQQPLVQKGPVARVCVGVMVALAGVFGGSTQFARQSLKGDHDGATEL